MFTFSATKKLRKRAGEFAEVARKIHNYRKDVLPEEALSELGSVYDGASALASDKSLSAEKLADREGEWESVLKKHGGHIYPKTFLNDNIETFLVAAIIVLGVRAFFLQPFIIPTNSMYPTYSGMYHQIYDEEDRPSMLAQPLRFLFLGARNREVVAEGSGNAILPLRIGRDDRGNLTGEAAYDVVPARKWLVVPTKNKRYPILMEGEPAYFEVPLEFNADAVLLDRFYPDANDWAEVFARERATGRLRIENGGRAFLMLPGQYEAGEEILNFDILSGDALFVDRFTYHFFPPETGEPIVFRTGGIVGPKGPLDDKYYIKRLAGTGEQTLAIDDPVLFVNGEPADQSKAFVKNNEQIDGYDGYVSGWNGMQYLDPGTSYEIPENEFFVLGDNSRNSQDSRYFGSFDEKRVIGRALFIYYPFTKRWGPAE